MLVLVQVFELLINAHILLYLLIMFYQVELLLNQLLLNRCEVVLMQNSVLLLLLLLLLLLSLYLYFQFVLHLFPLQGKPLHFVTFLDCPGFVVVLDLRVPLGVGHSNNFTQNTSANLRIGIYWY